MKFRLRTGREPCRIRLENPRGLGLPDRMPPIHPTLVLLHNPQALRIEYCVDDSRLSLWWSPLAGKSWDAADRNFSNRDDHLEVFDRIEFEGLPLADFLGCDYDPYHSVLRFRNQTLHLAPRPDSPAVVVWAEQPLTVHFKTARYDRVLRATPTDWVVSHAEPSRTFEFTACLGFEGTSRLRHSPVHAPANSHYVQARMEPGSLLVIGAGLEGEAIAERCRDLAALPVDRHLHAIETTLAPQIASGRTVSTTHPELDRLRSGLVRGLHSMIDESGAYRASIKAIYYLIWVRDSAFSFYYQTAAGWPHRLPELCRLLLANSTHPEGAPPAPTGMFAQLVNRTYGKLEEDGAFYAILCVFTNWVQSGFRHRPDTASLAILRGAVAWVDGFCRNAATRLYEGRFADETPAFGSRDYGWDFAIGKPAGDEAIRHEGRRIVRSVDIYLNTLMHGAHRMLSCLAEGEAARWHGEQADGLERALQPLYADRVAGLPPYGDLIAEDGSVHRARPWGPASSVYVWALSLPNQLALDDRDALQGALLDALLAKPALHFINGLCSAAAAADPIVHGETRQLRLLRAIHDETLKPGRYMPMGGAMPEKFDAPQGNLYHDIRPQGFAMGAWLGAWASLGVRLLPLGLAVRATSAYERLSDYAWAGGVIDFEFLGEPGCPLTIDGTSVPGTLQLPEELLGKARTRIQVRPAGDSLPRLVRSNVRLLSVSGSGRSWEVLATGSSEVVFSDPAGTARAVDASGARLETSWRIEGALGLLRFRHAGKVTLTWEA